MSAPATTPDPALARIAATIERRLRRQFPSAPAHLVRAHTDAAVRDFAGAPVRNYLPILIERRAADALREPGPIEIDAAPLVTLAAASRQAASNARKRTVRPSPSARFSQMTARLTAGTFDPMPIRWFIDRLATKAWIKRAQYPSSMHVNKEKL